MDGIAQLALTLAVGTVASFAVFKLSVLLYERVKSPLLNPLLVTVAFIIAALVALRIPLDSYEQSVQLISFLLGPATVALAYSVYRQRQTLKEHFVPIFAGCLVGSVVSMASAYALCKLLGLDDALALSFIPKSVTTPIAIAVSQQLGGITSITVAAVIVTGILGAITAPLMARLFRVRDGIAKGVAIGTCSHAVGTTKALEMGERKTVHHACGGNGVCASIIGAVSKTVQTGKTLWHSRSFGEFNQRSALLIKPLMVRNRSHRTSVRASEINHGPPVFFGHDPARAA